MSKFTDAERRAVMEESARLLADKPPPSPPAEPVREPELEPAAVDHLAEWRDWHDARDVERQAERERRQREELRAQADATTIFWDEIDRRVQAALAEQREQLIGLIQESARAVGDFADSVDKKLAKLERDLDQRRKEHARESYRVNDLAETHRREVEQLRKEVLRQVEARELAHTRQITSLQSELSRAHASLVQQHADDRADERHTATILELRELKRPN